MERLTLFIFIDALGWEVLRDRSFLEEELPHRREMRSVFGYSSACVPSILSGLSPQDHGHWSFYFRNEENSPFKPFKWMRYLPFQNRGRVRNQLSKLVKKALGWTGYFQLYGMPFQHLDHYDYCEKKDLFKVGGLNKGSHIFDYLAKNEIPYHVSNWRLSETENMQAVTQDLEVSQPRFAFLYMAGMDALLHDVGKLSDKVDEKLRWYEEHLRSVFATAEKHYENVDIFVCSDHGMATVHTTVDLMKTVEALPVEYAKDYLSAFDSTLARFWFDTDEARLQITECLQKQSCGRIIPDEELKELGCDFENKQYGELIFLMNTGQIICPSHMGETPLFGMHGYHPDDPDSNASLLSSKEPSTDPRAITDLNKLMKAEISLTSEHAGEPGKCDQSQRKIA